MVLELSQDLLENGCVRLKPTLIWNRLGALVPSCEECFDSKCANWKGIKCPGCGSLNVKQRGTYRRQVKYSNFASFNADRRYLRCLNCGKSFTEQTKTLHAKTPQEVIDFALTQIEAGESLREIEKQIQKKYGIKRTATTIWLWKQNQRQALFH